MKAIIRIRGNRWCNAQCVGAQEYSIICQVMFSHRKLNVPLVMGKECATSNALKRLFKPKPKQRP